MFARHAALLSAFAGGCLTSAALLGVLRGGGGSEDGRQSPRRGDAVSASVEASRAAVAAGSKPSEPNEPSKPNEAPARGHDATRPPGTTSADAPSAEPGRSVADVLGSLEAAYQERLVVAEPRTASSSTPSAPTSEPEEPPSEDRAASGADTASEPSVRAGDGPTGTVLAAAPESPPREKAAPEKAVAANVAASAGPANPGSAPATTAPAAAIATAAAPVPATPTVGPVYVGDIHQNVYLGSVSQTDVYQLELQQLALLQYMQLLALSPAARFAAPRHAHRGAAAPRAPAFTSTLTNPDNPWGFTFPPPMLVK